MNPDKIRNVLNILFMVLALAAIIIYFAAKDDFKLFIYMERLRSVDQVAYVRFASVYRQFKDIDTFMAELNKLLSEK